jgi:hypothetical protein
VNRGSIQNKLEMVVDPTAMRICDANASEIVWRAPEPTNAKFVITTSDAATVSTGLPS